MMQETSPQVVARLLELLEVREERGRAMVALGRLGAVELIDGLERRIVELDGFDFSFLIVALEALCEQNDDPEVHERVRRELFKALPQAGRDQIWDLCHALEKLTGADPVISMTEPEDRLEEMRRTWLRLGTSSPTPEQPIPRVEEIRELEDAFWSFVIEDGSGIVRIDYDPPPEGSGWPRWGRSLYVGKDPLYSVGSHCGTCEFNLTFAGWPSERAAAAAAKIRDALAHVPAITTEILATLTPLLGLLRSGHYLATVVALDLQEVREQDDEISWWKRRYELRVSEDDDDDWYDEDEDEDEEIYWWPKARHYQVRERLDGEIPGYAFLFPSQPPEFDADTVADFEREIAAGRVPLAPAVSWVDDRYVSAEFPERILMSILLDGHHKTAAYVARGVPARVLLICRLEDTFGPVEDRGRYFREAVASLRQSGSA